MIPQLPQTPNVGPEIPNDLYKWLIELGNRIRALIEQSNIPISDISLFSGDCGLFGYPITSSIDFGGFYSDDWGGF
jgi:hypothetical protein